MARTMLNESKFPYIFWREVIYTIVYILNKEKLRVNGYKTPYHLLKGIPTIVKHFKVFGTKCYIQRDGEDMNRFDSRSDEGIFLGYSCNNKAYRC